MKPCTGESEKHNPDYTHKPISVCVCVWFTSVEWSSSGTVITTSLNTTPVLYVIKKNPKQQVLWALVKDIIQGNKLLIIKKEFILVTCSHLWLFHTVSLHLWNQTLWDFENMKTSYVWSLLELSGLCDWPPSSWSAGLQMPFSDLSCWLLTWPSALMTCCITASTIGITMATVEVLLSHMERKAQPTMKPSINLQ